MLIDADVRKQWRRQIAATGKRRPTVKHLVYGTRRPTYVKVIFVPQASEVPAEVAAEHSFFECRIEAFDGGNAKCLADVGGTLLPVEMPIVVLQAKGLRPGMSFVWRAASPQPAPEDIQVEVSADADRQAPLPRDLVEEAIADSEAGFWSAHLERR